MTFDEAFERLIGHEGGFQNDPQDRGNWTGGKVGKGELKGTKYGISAASYPHLDIKNVTLAESKALYEKDYWDKTVVNLIEPPLDFTLFDIAVNSGVLTAHKYLQKALGVEADGHIGPVTEAALYMAYHEGNYDAIDNRVNAIRLLEMADMKGFSRYGKGWVRRVANNILESNEV